MFTDKKKECEKKLYSNTFIKTNKATKQILASVIINAQRAEGHIGCGDNSSYNKIFEKGITIWSQYYT